MNKKLYGGIAVALTAAGIVATAAPAFAAPPGGTSKNVTGEAGYYVKHWNNWHMRDAHASFKITSAMESLSGGSTYPGATGVELCDDDSNYAAQLGVTFLNGQFEVLGAYGQLTSMGTSDPCSQNGVIPTNSQAATPSLAGGAAVQLAGADGIGAGVSVLSSPATAVFTGNQFQPSVDETPLAVGDEVVVDLYYNPTPVNWWSGLHNLQMTVQVYDASGSFVAEHQYIERIKAQNFYEAAIGAENTTADGLTAPASLPLVTFLNATFNNYNGSISNRLQGGEDLVKAQAVNGGGQVTMDPTMITGNSFGVNEGSASA